MNATKIRVLQKDLLAEDWTQVTNRPQIQVKRVEREGELYVLTRSLARAEKERAMRQRVLKGLRKDLAKLSHAVRSGRVHRKELIYTRLGRLAERWSLTSKRCSESLRSIGSDPVGRLQESAFRFKLIANLPLMSNT